jgi:hypothetical protein
MKDIEGDTKAKIWEKLGLDAHGVDLKQAEQRFVKVKIQMEE